MVYNASAYKNVKDEKIQGFLQLVSTNKPGEDELSKKLSDLVEKLKDNEKFRSEYAAMNLHDRDIIRQAKKEASLDKAIEDATNLLKENISVEIIAKCTGLEIEKVLELQKEIKHLC